MSKRTPHRWLLAIRDCGVLRVRFDDAVLIDGIEHGWIDAQPVDGDEDALDVRLAPPAIQYFTNLRSPPAQVVAGRPSPCGDQRRTLSNARPSVREDGCIGEARLSSPVGLPDALNIPLHSSVTATDRQEDHPVG